MESKRILVVEDEIIVAKNLQNRLESLGYTVPSIVTNGEDAVKMANKVKPDLVLMDIMLEGDMDGVEAAQQISQRFDIPVIYLTAYGDDQTLQRAKVTDPYGFILKPFELRELHNNIEIALYKRTISSKLKDNEKWLSTVLMSIGDAVIATDREEFITFMNPIAEVLTGWKQKDVLGKPLKSVFNVVNEKNHKVIKNFVNIAVDKDAAVDLNLRNVILKGKDGDEKHIDNSVAPIKDHEGNITGCIIVFRDITRHRQTELDLEKYRFQLRKMVEERTEELSKTNKQLLNEIDKRRMAEEEANKMKDSLQNIIDSASEIIISFDKANRLVLWNKSAEVLTGYKKKDVNGKLISDLSIFDKSDEFLRNLNSFYNEKKPGFSELILNTKNGDKRIINVSCSFVKGNTGEEVGVLFVGTDVTSDLESHGKLLNGCSYLITDKDNKSLLKLFIALNKHDHESLFITRDPPEIISGMTFLKDCKVVLLSQKKLGGFEHISNLEELINKIRGFAENNSNSVVLLTGVHYFLTRFSFEKFIDIMYHVREIISDANSILLLYLDPLLLDERQIAVMKNEFQILPGLKLDDVHIGNDLFDILLFIFNENQINSEVSFKRICKKFSIVPKTASNRIRMLEKKGLVFIKKRGRIKSLYVSQKGKSLLCNRQMI